jgi:hypothetical protein
VDQPDRGASWPLVRVALPVAFALCACGPRTAGSVDTGLDSLALESVGPTAWLPATHVVLTGRGFVDASLGRGSVALAGQFGGTSFDIEAPITTRDSGHADWYVNGEVFGGRTGHFRGRARVDFDSLVDGATHSSAPLAVELDVVATLAPRVDQLATEPVFVNDVVTAVGDGFLLGDREGDTVAHVEGCFQPAGAGTCARVAGVDLPATPHTPLGRTAVDFVYAPAISGLALGQFQGQVTLRDRLPDGTEHDATPMTVTWHIGPPAILATPTVASLGQRLAIRGGGFVGDADSDEATLLRLDGSFTPEAGGAAQPVSVRLVPTFVSGQLLEYVVDDEDALGTLLMVRAQAGRLRGTLVPITSRGSETVMGAAAPLDLAIGHVKQVVWVRFLDGYTESLERFGVRALDDRIRARIFAVARRDYAGVNIEFRDTEPLDFALYEIVDIGGPDPNDMDLLGYDNTPGKDVGNLRLFDHIGGVNAATQSDGFPGYGGVFTLPFLGFSEHPSDVARLAIASPLFDRIFDPFRAEWGGRPADAEDATDTSVQAGQRNCPALGRSGQVACAAYVLGNLLGTTLTHEVGHSLGLANPYGEGFHDAGDAPNRLMDVGNARPFAERAELMGEGPAVFCDDEYAYLQGQILRGASQAAPAVARPRCN